MSFAKLAGSKKFNITFNKQVPTSVITNLLPIIGINTTITVNYANNYSNNDLLGFVKSAGSKKLTISFTDYQPSSTSVKSLINSAGANTTLSLGRAHTFTANDLIAFAKLAK